MRHFARPQEAAICLTKEHRVADCDTSLLSPVQQIKCGLRVEIEDVHRARTVWPGTVVRNVGGRLLVKYLLPQDGGRDVADDVEAQLWIFCLSTRLHRAGWAMQEQQQQQQWQYKPPQKLASLLSSQHDQEQWQQLVSKFHQQEEEEEEEAGDVGRTFSSSSWQLATHSFRVGDNLLALAPWDRTALKGATVVQVVDNRHFVIRFDSPTADTTETTLCCHAGDGNCFPVSNEGGGEGEEQSNAAEVKSDGDQLEPAFGPSMALEVVDPRNADRMCVASIAAVERCGLLRIRLDVGQRRPTNDDAAKNNQSDQLDQKRGAVDDGGIQPEMLASCSSFDLFPVGWCETYGFPLVGPSSSSSSSSCPASDSPVSNRPAEEQTPAETITSAAALEETTTPCAVSYWCPKIYFNFRCFSGPLLSKLRIAALPRSVGPGPILLVLKEVLSLLINGAYKPGGVLKQLQGEPGALASAAAAAGALPKGTQLEPLKAKYKQTTYRGSVPIASTAADVADYCRW